MIEVSQMIPLLPFWEKLSADERAFVKRNSAIRRAAAGQLLYSRDCACMGLVWVISGSIRIFSLSPEGREITLFRLGAGEPCVLSASCVIGQLTFDTHMTAETDCELLVMNAEAFAELTDRNIYARCFLFEQASSNFSSVMHTMESILFERFDRRLAGFLISEYERTGERVIPLTQSEIAEKVNSAREVVARMLKQFSTEGLVRTGRGSVTLLDPEGLGAK